MLGWLASGCAQDPSVPPWFAADSGVASASIDAGSLGASAPAADALIPARIRRLSNAEYNGSVAALLGTQLTPGRDFAPDARQSGFTVNEAQRVDAVLAKQLYAAAEQLAADARGQIAEIAPCTTPADPETCARWFIWSFGTRAYRRPLTSEEGEALLEVYRAGALDESYDDGIELVISAILQSAGFLYLTELGDGAAASPGSVVALTEFELASSLAYLMTGEPPDPELLDAAAVGALASPEQRRAQLQRLRHEHPASRDQLVRTLREWLELDRIEYTAKDIAFYPSYDQFAEKLSTESRDFIAAVLDEESADSNDLHTLLAADWTVGDEMLAGFYGAPEIVDGRIPLEKRRGILNQGAFLAVHAHAYESSPILRGAVIARRLACIAIPDPSSLGISAVPPVSDPKLTTRQRFDAHVADPSCAGCHKTIDGFGNAFEEYDGMGALRDTENEATVDSSTSIAIGADFDGSYLDGNALAEALAGSATVEACFARYLFRAASARGDGAGSEEAFIVEWQALPAAERGNVVDTLSALVSSPLFTHRRAP